ncbi:MAG TPA: tripartite tricarboxylate transporter substrate binding protein [Usitatibacter sp.]|nr:tripartite tricarboxylate transporter substrate binding protein [Usitatibacter sp.]
MNTRTARAAFAALLVLAFSLAARADEWPTGPIHIIVPFGPGSTPDIVARVVADKLSPKIGQPVVVENKTGAAGNIGTGEVARAKPDGQTIGLSIAGPLGVNSMLFKKLPYDPRHDLAPVTIAATQPSVLVVSPRLGVNSTQQLLDLLRKQPGKLNYASMGAGTISHLAMEALAARSGTQIVHVPYSGSGPAVLALLSGDAQVACLPAAAVIGQVKAGKLKALAVATAKRSSILPDLPTLAEAGLKNVYAEAWMGFVVPAKTPQTVVKRLHDDIAAILEEPEVRKQLAGHSMDVVADTPAQMRATLDADMARWKPIIEKNHITLD